MTDILDFTLGSTFRVRWVSSGATAAPISFSIFSGSETLITSYVGVNSGNGFYYVDANLNPSSWAPEIYKGRWIATVAANTYIDDIWLNGFPQDTDQPGRYITWNEVVQRYTDFSDLGGAVKAASHYISFAEAAIDGMLSPKFSTPFSKNNVTVKDIVIDMAFLKGARLKSEEREEISADISSRIGALLAGTAFMVTTSGDIITPSPGKVTAWSSTEDYHPVFGPFDPLDWVVSSQQTADERTERGFFN